ncbi:ComF family protein [Enterococcus sp. CWB-B31]|nr:ComF family protein [Enterococcus sp. CWB-B31]
MNCVYCEHPFIKVPSITELLLFKPISDHELCLQCQKKFHLIDKSSVCSGCCREYPGNLCEDCKRWQSKYPAYPFSHTALFHYDSEMKQWFEEYKFKGNYTLSHTFSKEISNFFKQKKNSLIIPLPLSQKRLAIRGFNQVEGILASAGVSYSDYLLRIREDKPQAQKSRLERLSGEQPFVLKPEYESCLTNQAVFLVDDIYTTGRTLFYASEIILKYPVKKLETFSLAR